MRFLYAGMVAVVVGIGVTLWGVPCRARPLPLRLDVGGGGWRWVAQSACAVGLTSEEIPPPFFDDPQWNPCVAGISDTAALSLGEMVHLLIVCHDSPSVRAGTLKRGEDETWRWLDEPRVFGVFESQPKVSAIALHRGHHRHHAPYHLFVAALTKDDTVARLHLWALSVRFAGFTHIETHHVVTMGIAEDARIGASLGLDAMQNVVCSTYLSHVVVVGTIRHRVYRMESFPNVTLERCVVFNVGGETFVAVGGTERITRLAFVAVFALDVAPMRRWIVATVDGAEAAAHFTADAVVFVDAAGGVFAWRTLTELSRAEMDGAETTTAHLAFRSEWTHKVLPHAGLSLA